jgi:murein DD-endopeptidase MepM/ murein hydrolase activator NlpD
MCISSETDQNHGLVPLWIFLVITSLMLSACSFSIKPLNPNQAVALSSQPAPQLTPDQPAPTPMAAFQPIQPSSGDSSNSDRGQLLSEEGVFLYFTQAGDTLAAVAARFGVQPEMITSDLPLRTPGLLDPGISLRIPVQYVELSRSQSLLPDSEVIYSPSAAGFDVSAYVNQAGGYFSHTQDSLSGELLSGADILARVALDNSINPRLLLAILEYECNCVLGEPERSFENEDILGIDASYGLYHQLVWVAEQLSNGYYGWRSGQLTQLELPGGEIIRLSPMLNAGTVALMTYMAQYEIQKKADRQTWEKRLDPTTGFMELYQRMFEKPWVRAAKVEPLFPPNLTQPKLQFPFEIAAIWSYSGGPHWAWEHSGPLAAIDLAPASAHSGCVPSVEWVTAVADGLVVRSERGAMLQDLDGDGLEQTGWVILYLHVDTARTIKTGDYLHAGDRIGHPSCEGGRATGTHLHLARKFNGEWMTVKDSVPFILDGWIVHAGENPYEGTMTSGGQTCIANSLSPSTSWILRPVGGK